MSCHKRLAGDFSEAVAFVILPVLKCYVKISFVWNIYLFCTINDRLKQKQKQKKHDRLATQIELIPCINYGYVTSADVCQKSIYWNEKISLTHES